MFYREEVIEARLSGTLRTNTVQPSLRALWGVQQGFCAFLVVAVQIKMNCPVDFTTWQLFMFTGLCFRNPALPLKSLRWSLLSQQPMNNKYRHQIDSP